MNDNGILLGKLRVDPLTFPPVGKCIYCGLVPADPAELTDEHIVAYALNGNMILQKASCKRCSDITSAFEGVVARDQFGVFRAHRNYQTRRKGKRLGATRRIEYFTVSGERKTKMISVVDYPTEYISVSYAPPGILTGAEPSDGSPPMNVTSLHHPEEMKRAVEAIGEPVLRIETSLSFAWRPFSLTLAKIAHSFLVAALGTRGYIAFLPELIIGEPDTGGFLSYYVGGYGVNPPPEWMFARHHVQMDFKVLQSPTVGLYAIVNIALVGGVRMSTYQIVAAQITDYSVVEKAAQNPIFAAFNPPSPAVAPA
jgi:hypothetical protein